MCCVRESVCVWCVLRTRARETKSVCVFGVREDERVCVCV